jgi:hypothetical protein
MTTLNTMTEGQTTISDFESYGSGWAWTTIRAAFDFRTGQVEAVAYSFRTSQQGNGLWIDGKQVYGTCQFSLPGYDRTAARRKALRFVKGAW